MRSLLLVLALASFLFGQEPCPRCGKVHEAQSGSVLSGVDGGAALAAANAQRARRGLRPFIYDPNLQAAVNRNASIQANRGRMYHPGGFGPGARGEGVGASGSMASFTTCYLYSNYTHAAAASYRGRNGMWYHCLQVSGAGSSSGGSYRRGRRWRRR